MSAIRKQIIAHDRGVPTGFRLRGEEVSRLEGFSDAVFGFALTLLVVSLEVPKTYLELMGAMRGFVAFALCFGLLSQVWLNHYRFFRRYGLEDSHTARLNLILLFVVVFYTYPLKFLFTLLMAAWFHIAPPGGMHLMITNAQMPNLIMIYGIGFAAIFLVFALMYLHAYQLRKVLELNALEQYDTRASIFSNLFMVGMGGASVLLTAVHQPIGASLVYVLIAPFLVLFFAISNYYRRVLEKQEEVPLTEECLEAIRAEE